MPHLILVILFTVALLPALIMAFVPFFPTFWYLLAVGAIFLVVDGFSHLTAANAAILGGLFVLSILVDWSAGLLGAKFGGAGWKSLVYGAIGGFMGFFIFPPLGTFAGLFVGVLLGELARHKETGSALRAATGTLIGTVTGVGINLVLAVLFVVLFFLFAL